MKQIVVMVFLMAVFGSTSIAGTEQSSTSSQQKNQKQRIQVVGIGKSTASATMNARSNAAKVVGSYSFYTVSQKTSGKDDEWTCILIVEFEEK